MSAPLSWGRIPFGPPAESRLFRSRNDQLPPGAEPLLVVGRMRSYGDVCCNPGGVVIRTEAIDHLIHFDREEGRLLCEAGTTLEQILRVAVPAGWFVPVTPGTRHVSVGGAIANDVHGKNHFHRGTFAHHVRAFELLRSDGSRLRCSMEENPEWFAATIGGLGLTGMIVWAELQLVRIPGPGILRERARFEGVDEAVHLWTSSEAGWEHTVAWLDAAAGRRTRGVFFRGNHVAHPADLGRPGWLRVPWTPPVSLLSGPLARAFNTAYDGLQRIAPAQALIPLDRFFYPLDGIGAWNRLYGPRGFYQYQCVLAAEGVPEILERVRRHGVPSFLTVLKRLGARPSVGMLSFARPGFTLALDFARGASDSERLFRDLDDIVVEHGGALYPAKDARMSGVLFHASFPRFEEFRQYVDPRFSSSLWQRVTSDDLLET